MVRAGSLSADLVHAYLPACSARMLAEASHLFTEAETDWGFSQMLPVADLAPSVRYLQGRGGGEGAMHAALPLER